jgi:hypothetical protein
MSGRAIDRAEPAIVRVMARCDAGSGLRDACQHVATDYAITADRLEHLTRVWCAIGGFPVPAEPAAMIPRDAWFTGARVAECPTCGRVCAYWDADDLDDQGNLMCWHVDD